MNWKAYWHTLPRKGALFSQKLSAYVRLIRLNRPIGILLLLWPTLSALWIASQGIPSFKLLFIFVMGTILMRSAGCAINDLADNKWDGKVARTQNRPLVRGEITRKEAFSVFALLSLLAFLLVLMTNGLTILLSFLALAVAVIYPFMKRITHLPQMVLSVAFAFGIPMAFAAQLNSVPLEAWLLFLATAFWIMVYDTFYAMTDRDDDIKVGIKSTAILWGEKDRWVTGILQILVLVFLVILGKTLDFRWMDYSGILLAALLFIYQQILIRKREPQACFKAFLNNNWVGFFVFLGFCVHYPRFGS